MRSSERVVPGPTYFTTVYPTFLSTMLVPLRVKLEPPLLNYHLLCRFDPAGPHTTLLFGESSGGSKLSRWFLRSSRFRRLRSLYCFSLFLFTRKSPRVLASLALRITMGMVLITEPTIYTALMTPHMEPCSATFRPLHSLRVWLPVMAGQTVSLFHGSIPPSIAT